MHKSLGLISLNFSKAEAGFTEQAAVHAFGSSVNGFGDETSDIDLVLDVPEDRLQKMLQAPAVCTHANRNLHGPTSPRLLPPLREDEQP